MLRLCALMFDSVLCTLMFDSVIPPAEQVVWRQGGVLHHREFKVEREATEFYHALGASARKRLTRRGREIAVAGVDERGWPLEWLPDHPSAYQLLDDFLCSEDLARLGALPQRVRVKLDASMNDSAHGRAERCKHTNLPLCLVNPSTPDMRYVILHELMHHQLNELGCPALVIPNLRVGYHGDRYLGSAVVPSGSFLQQVDVAVDPTFVSDLLTTLWELIQHSRFNPFIMKNFGCGAQNARDRMATDILSGVAVNPYCSARDGRSVRTTMMAMHFATAALEGSPRVSREFACFLRAQGDEGREVLDLGQRVAQQIHPADIPVCSLSPAKAEAMIAGMLLDLEGALEVLLSPMRAEVGQPEKLDVLWQHSCRAVSRLAFYA